MLWFIPISVRNTFNFHIIHKNTVLTHTLYIFSKNFPEPWSSPPHYSYKFDYLIKYNWLIKMVLIHTQFHNIHMTWELSDIHFITWINFFVIFSSMKKKILCHFLYARMNINHINLMTTTRSQWIFLFSLLFVYVILRASYLQQVPHTGII